MTKRYATFVQHLYHEILSDLADEMPELRKGLIRDYSRLCSALETRGLSFFTIDLVEYGKHFDKCLSSSRLTRIIGPHMSPYKSGVVIPRLFKGLLQRVFQDSGELAPTWCVRSIRGLRQLYYAAKKLRMECTHERTFKTVRKFYQVEASLPLPSLAWDGDDLGMFDKWSLCFKQPPNRHVDINQLLLPGIEEVVELPGHLQRYMHFACDAVVSLIGVFDPYKWRSKHGPGAVSDQKGGSKYEFPSWPKKLESIFPLADFAFANFGLWADTLAHGEDKGRFSLREFPSKLIAVPKTQKGPRLIASEPTCHQWCQQIIKDFLHERSSTFFLKNSVHFRDQSFNQRAARQASISQSHWTIDLSDASDRVSCYVVERVFRSNPDLLRAFHAVRTRSIMNTIDRKRPRLSLLRKFSTMGSALTFPVESIVFSCLAYAAFLWVRKMPMSLKSLDIASRQVLVFGDDLIVPKDVGPVLTGILRSLFFEVNHNKTFGKGKFRESCGGEYFDGTDVTPIYSLTYPERCRPESLVSVVATHNNFVKGCYARTAEYLKRTVMCEKTLSIPTLYPGSGRFCWESLSEEVKPPKSRWNNETSQREYRVHEVKTRARRHPDRVASRLLQYFTEAPSPDLPWASGWIARSSVFLNLGWVAL